jgi:transposase
MQLPSEFWGIDAGSKELVVARAGQTAVLTLVNRRTAIRAWLEHLPGDAHLGIEATGRYHLVLARLAVQRGLKVFVLDARRIRAYSHALGHRGKTDRLDAVAIAEYLAATYRQLRPYLPPTPIQRRIDTMLRRRCGLVEIRTRLRQMARALPGARGQLERVVDPLDRLIDSLQQQATDLTRREPGHAQTMHRLETIPSFGPLVSVALSNLFERVHFDCADRAVAFVGLDPRPADSSHRHGRRRLTKRGPGELRRLLHLAAMSAAKTTLWKPFYQHDRQRGLATTEALVILSRRLLRTAWAITSRGTTFDPLRVRGPRPAP